MEEKKNEGVNMGEVTEDGIKGESERRKKE